MSTNLLDISQQILSEDVVLVIANLIGESPDKTKSAITSAMPTLFVGLIQKVSTVQGATAMFDLIKHGGHNGVILNNITEVISKNTSNLLSSGTGIVEAIFGAKSSSVSSVISGVSGLNQAAAGKLLSVLAPVVMGLLGKQIKTLGVTHSSGLTSMLMAQKDVMKNSIPAGLGAILGFSNLADLGVAPESAGAASIKKFIPLTAASLAAIGLLWVLKQRTQENISVSRDTQETVHTTAAGEAQEAATQVLSNLGNLLKKTLSTGVEISVPENGIENKLIAYIENTALPVDKTTAFPLDRISFADATSKLEEDSYEQLKNVSEILKAFPSVELAIKGSGSKTKADAALAKARSEAIVGELVHLGVAPSRLKAEGDSSHSDVMNVRVTKK